MTERDRLINVRNELEHICQLVLLLQNYNVEVEALPNVPQRLVDGLHKTALDIGDSINLAYSNLEMGLQSQALQCEMTSEEILYVDG